jgi:hypothetical protein
MRLLITVCCFVLTGCTTLVPSDPQAAREQLARDLNIPANTIIEVWPCIFAVTPPVVRRAEFTECAFVQTEQAAYVARAIRSQKRFKKAVVLDYAKVRGFKLRNWGIGASQLQFMQDTYVVTVGVKVAGPETPARPAENARIAEYFRKKGVSEIESPGRVDQELHIRSE